MIVAVVAVMLLNITFFSRALGSSSSWEVPYNVFLTELDKENIHQVEVNENNIYFSLHDDSEYKQSDHYNYATSIYGEPKIILYCVRMDDPDLVDRLYNAGAEFAQVEPKQTPWIIQFIVSSVVPLLLFFFLSSLFSSQVCPQEKDTGTSAGGGPWGLHEGTGPSPAHPVCGPAGVSCASSLTELQTQAGLVSTS